MAGLYIHIPFCKSRCIYCGFYSTTHAELQQRYVDAVCRELEERLLPPTMKSSDFHTVYIGGGTPSQLSQGQLEQLFGKLHGTGVLSSSEEEEVTFEVNPDDVTAAYAALLVQLGVNRVSMGAQTFDDERLRFLRRRHDSRQVFEAVEHLQKAGIGNISIDLMYGFPGETVAQWQQDIRSALSLGAQHLSAYGLMYEEDTPLYRLLEQGKVEEADEEVCRQMYYELKDRLEEAGFEHYEISNFARPGHRSRHNSSYWNFTPYIGLGAAAHSFDGERRWWNPSHLIYYIEGAGEHGGSETITPSMHYDEVVMLRLRTCEGIGLDSELTADERAYCMAAARPFIDDGLLKHDGCRLRLTRRGLFVSNMVMSGLMKG